MEKSSWRVSLRKSARKSLRALIGGGSDTLSNDIVKYRGISLQALIEINERLVSCDAAQGVKLYVLQEKIEEVEAGRTIQGNAKGESFIARVPFRKQRLEVPSSSVVLKEREEWTIEDVCEFYVLPETLTDDSFFLDCIKESQIGKPFQGAFVSQARKSSFSGLVKALEHYYAGRDHTKVYLWIDIFCANQPLLTRKDRGLKDNVQADRWHLLNSGLHQAIDRFEERLIFFNTWDNPYPLQRAWCIWEIYGAARSGKSLDIIFDPSADKDVIEKLMDDKSSLLQAISDLDPRKMDCHSKSDLEMIQSAVETLEGGFSSLKATITARLRRWLLLTVEMAVKRKDKEHSSANSIEFAELLNQAGIFMRSMNEKEVALSYYARALKIRKERLGERHPSVAQTYNNMGIILKNQGKYNEGLEMYRKALEIFIETLGERHPALCDTYLNMGVIFKNQGKFDEAMEMYSKALELKKESFGENHPFIADVYNNMGIILKNQGKNEDALTMYRKAFQIRTERFGERYPSVADVYNNMGIVFKNQGKYAKAMEMFTKALEIRKETLGDSHPSVAQTYNNMGVVHEIQGNNAEARRLFSAALSVAKVSLGMNHPETRKYQRNLDRRNK